MVISGTVGVRRSRTLDNLQTATWRAGNIHVSDGGRINNPAGALFEVLADGSLVNGSGSARFTNAGTFRKAAGAGMTQFLGVAFDNSGRAELLAGGLRLTGTGTATGSITGTGTLSFGNNYTLAAGSRLALPHVVVTTGRVDVHGVYDVPGSTTLDGAGTATLSLNPSATLADLGRAITVKGGYLQLLSGEDVTTDSFLLSTGRITGTANLTVHDDLTWNGGTLGGAGRIVSNGRLLIGTSTSNRRDLDGRTLENNGTATWTGRQIYAYNGGTIRNNATGTFDITGDGTIMWCNYVVVQGWGSCKSLGAQPVFANAGRVTKSGGSGTLRFWYLPAPNDELCAGAGNKSRCQVAFTNTGTVEARSGVLEFADYVQSAGATRLLGGSVAQLRNKTLDIQGGQLAGTGTITATVAVGGRLEPGGSLTAGTLRIVGAYLQRSTGRLMVELGGTGLDGQFDRLDVTGSATLAGTLDVSTIGGHVPASGASYGILSYGSRAGSFADLVGNGRAYTVTYGATGASLGAP
jgi:hypothetical protein